MARLWSCSAGLQSAVSGLEFTSTITSAPAIETSLGVGTQGTAYRINSAVGIEGFRQVYTAAQGDYYFRWYDYIVALPTVATAILGGFRITGSYKIDARLTTAGLLQFFNAEDTAQIGADSSAISTGVRYRFEMRCNSTTLASTLAEFRVYDASNNLIYNPSGTIDLAALPTQVGCATTAGNATFDHVVSDMAVNDTAAGGTCTSWCGAESLVYAFPNANGDNSAWTGSDADSTDNYLLIDEIPPDSADYVQSNTSGQIDDYNITNMPAGVGATDTINVVHVGVYAAVSDATSGDPDIVLRIKATASGIVEESGSLDCNSVTFQGPAPLPANSNYQLTLYDLPGASTTVWTKADLDTAQIGVRESASDAHFARVAAIWLIAGHTPSAAEEIRRKPVIINQAVKRAAFI